MLSRGRFARVTSFTSNTEMSTRAALEASGVGRLRAMIVSMLALIHLGLICAAVIDGPSYIKLTAWVSLCLLLAAFGLAWWSIQRTERLEPRLLRLLAAPVSLTVIAAHFAFGMFSAFSAAVTLGLLLFASAARRLEANLAYGALALGYGVVGFGVHTTGFVYEPFFAQRFREPWQQDAAVLAVELLFFSAYAAGRMIRREQAHLFAQFERAVRETSLREALLREARDALRNAAGIGSPGRFTDQELGGFRLGNVIGRGGMGEVYEAAREVTGERAAVKLLRLDVLSERTALSRFEREARIIASIDSPHVVQVRAVSDATSAFPFIAMELLVGSDLSSYLRDQGRLPLAEVVELVEQLAAGLAAAHSLKVVHRDLKPNNIFRTIESGRVVWKVLDFGVSKLMDHGDATLTIAELVGTPQYMAPEQARGEQDLDQRADIYALAAIAYRSLAGEPPFTGQVPGILRRITDDMPRAPSFFCDLPRDVDLALSLGLTKRREDRYLAVTELAHALRAASIGRLDDSLRQRARTLLDARPFAA